MSNLERDPSELVLAGEQGAVATAGGTGLGARAEATAPIPLPPPPQRMPAAP